MRADFKRARESATSLLLSQRLRSLRIDVTRLEYDRNILFDSMQNFCRITCMTLRQLSDGSDCLRDGCTLVRRTEDGVCYLILYNLDAPVMGRREFTLAHEIGHIYLDHQEDGDKQEQEANAFAAQLLAPEVLVHRLAERLPGPLTANDICQVFAISRQAAEYRIQDLARFPNPYFSEGDRALLKKTAHLLPDKHTPVVGV